MPWHCIPQLFAGVTTFGGLPMADVEKSCCVIIWGANPFAKGSIAGCSLPRTRLLFNRLKRRGVKFIVIDPRVSDIASIADLHLRIRPGTDGMLALAMMRVLLEENLHDTDYVESGTPSALTGCGSSCTVSTLPVHRPLLGFQKAILGRLCACSPKCGLRASLQVVGVEHHTNTVQTLRAIMSLLALTSNVDVVGGNRFFAPAILSFPDQEELPTPTGKPIGAQEHPMFTGMINQAHALVVIEKILGAPKSPVQALIVAGGAPIPELTNNQ